MGKRGNEGSLQQQLQPAALVVAQTFCVQVSGVAPLPGWIKTEWDTKYRTQCWCPTWHHSWKGECLHVNMKSINWCPQRISIYRLGWASWSMFHSPRGQVKMLPTRNSQHRPLLKHKYWLPLPSRPSYQFKDVSRAAKHVHAKYKFPFYWKTDINILSVLLL